MLKKVSTLLFLALSSALSLELDEIVKRSFQNNNNLQAIQKSILVLDEDIKLSTKLKNPVLSFGINDIHFDEPLKRDKEPMQAQFIGISQTIPLNNKLQIKKDIAKKSKEIRALELENQKLLLKSKIYTYAYNIKILEKRVELLKKYQKNLQKAKSLLIRLFDTSSIEQDKILNIEIMEEKIKIEKINAKSNIKNLLIRLESISLLKIEKIDLDFKIGQESISISKTIENHPLLDSLKEEVNRLENLSKYEKSLKNSDMKVSLNYFNRDSKFEDYISLGVSIPLSVYKSEDIKSLKAKKMSRVTWQKYLDKKEEFNGKYKGLVVDMKRAQSLYNLIKLSIIKKQERIGEVLNSYNSYTQTNPVKLIDNLNEVLKYELQALNEEKLYFESFSKAIYFLGSDK